MAQLIMDGKATKRIKEKPASSMKFKKGVVISNKKEVEEILKEAFVIEVLERSKYDDDSESIVLKFHFK